MAKQKKAKRPVLAEMVKDEEKKKQFWFTLWLCTFIAFFLLGCYTVYLINNIGTIQETTTEFVDMDTDSGNNTYVGGDNSGSITNN